MIKLNYKLVLGLLAVASSVAVIFVMRSGSDHSSSPEKFKFAVIGDYGFHQIEPQAGERVASLIKSWNPDFIVTLGDNNYPNGHPDDIDDNIGQFYSDYIYPYTGKYGEGSPDRINKFFPTIGNHDRLIADGQAYFDYFSLPDNERYYDIKKGAVHLLILDSTRSDLRKRSSKQGQWTKQLLKNSDSPWKLVFIHHPPHSSSRRDTLADLRWPFRNWGITSLIAGHEHFYERIDNNGVPYFINGLGGATVQGFGEIMDAEGAKSVVRYNKFHGAMRITGDEFRITFEFININGKIVDRYQIQSDPAGNIIYSGE